MTDVPILMSAPMVRATLREIEAPGTGKTQTRRLAWQDKPDPADDNLTIRVRTPWKRLYDRWQAGERDVVIWVRETWFDPQMDGGRVLYAADAPEVHPIHRKRVSIHMPRWASRLTLIVTDLRRERLQDISEADAEAEGCVWDSADGVPVWYVPGARLPRHGATARECYALLWDSLNAARAPWSSNPAVVAISYRPIAVNIDQHRREAA